MGIKLNTSAQKARLQNTFIKVSDVLDDGSIIGEKLHGVDKGKTYHVEFDASINSAEDRVAFTKDDIGSIAGIEGAGTNFDKPLDGEYREMTARWSQKYPAKSFDKRGNEVNFTYDDSDVLLFSKNGVQNSDSAGNSYIAKVNTGVVLDNTNVDSIKSAVNKAFETNSHAFIAANAEDITVTRVICKFKSENNEWIAKTPEEISKEIEQLTLYKGMNGEVGNVKVFDLGDDVNVMIVPVKKIGNSNFLSGINNLQGGVSAIGRGIPLRVVTPRSEDPSVKSEPYLPSLEKSALLLVNLITKNPQSDAVIADRLKYLVTGKYTQSETVKKEMEALNEHKAQPTPEPQNQNQTQQTQQPDLNDVEYDGSEFENDFDETLFGSDEQFEAKSPFDDDEKPSSSNGPR